MTGLAWHEWLEFLLCALVLFRVILQWPWFATEFRRLFTPGAYRTRVNSALNYLLFRKGRPQSFRGGLRELDIAVLVVIFVVIIGRYVLRIHL